MKSITRIERKELPEDQRQTLLEGARVLVQNASASPPAANFDALVDYAWAQAEQAGNDVFNQFLGNVWALFDGAGWQVDTWFSCYMDKAQASTFDYWNVGSDGGYSRLEQGQDNTAVLFVTFK